MSAILASRIICILASVATLLLMAVALGPFGPRADEGDFLLNLLLFPFIAIWAVGPYAVANKFAATEDGSPAGWVYVVTQILVGLPVLWVYLDAFVLSGTADSQAGLVFVMLPVYQFIAVLVAYYAVRLMRQMKSST